jgi:hypothetical protein
MQTQNFISDLLNELSYRVGVPDLKNKEHQSIISEILTEWGEIDAKYIIMDFLNEAPKPSKDKTSGEDAEYHHLGAGVYVKKGQEKSPNAQKFTKNDAGQLQPISDDEYEKIKSKQGDDGETAAAGKNAAVANRMNTAGEKNAEKQQPETGTSLTTPEYQANIEKEKEIRDRLNGGGIESSEEVIKNVTDAFSSEVQDIIDGKKSPPGTGGSAIGETYGGISVKEFYNNSNLTEKEFIQSKYEEIKNSSLSNGLADKDIVGWLKVAYRTGRSEVEELQNNKKYKFKNPQSNPYPIPVMDPVNDKGSAKLQLLKLMKSKLDEAMASGDENAIKHYERQIKFIENRKDTDTGILYETNDGYVGFKHTSNKKSFSDAVFNSTVRVRGAVMQKSSEKVSKDYSFTEDEQKSISEKINNISNKAAAGIEQAASGPSGIVNANVSNPLEYAKDLGLGKLYKNLDGGQPGRKNYLEEVQQDIESNKGLGKKVNKYLQDKGIQKPYTDDQVAGALLGLSKDGDVTSEVTKMVTKLSDNVARVRSVMDNLRKKYPNKSEDELKQMTLKVLNGYKSKNAVPFDEKDINAMLSPEMDWIENTSKTIKDAMGAAYQQIQHDISKADEEWQRGHAPNEPQPPINGPHAQSYIDAYMKQMHWDRYILGNEEDIGDMNISGFTVNSNHIRECLANLSNYDGDLNTSDGKEGLMTHLRKTMKINSEKQSLTFDSEDGQSKNQIGQESYRTKGVGNNSILGNFGSDMQKCLKGKVTK